MTGEWAPLWTGGLVGLGALVLAGLFEHFHRIYGRRHLRIWALSWLVGGAHVLLDAVPFLPATPLDGAAGALRLLTGYAHCLLLVWGVYEGATAARASPRPVRIAAVSILGLSALAMVPAASGMAGVAYGATTAAAYLLTGLWLLTLTGPRCLGSAVVGVGVGVHGLLQIYGLTLARSWSGAAGIAALTSAMVEFVIALGLVIWLLEEARDRAVRATADSHEAERASLRRFRRLLEKGWDVVELRRPDGSLDWVSQSVERVLAIPVEDYMTAPPFEFVHPDDRRTLSRLLAPGTGGPEPVQLRMTGGDGRTRNMEAVSVDLSDDPEVGAIVLTSRDVTDRYRLQREVLEMSGRERQALGRELHDGLGQVLTGIGFRVAQLEGALRQKREDVPALAGEIKTLVRSAVTQADIMARGLSPVSMRADGLATALESLADSIGRLEDVRCTVGGVEVDIADPSMANQLYMIAEEAALSAVRSYGSRRIEMGIRASGDGGVLYVRCWQGSRRPLRSDGSEAAGRTTRERILHYRASLVDGALDIEDSDEGERTILCRFQQAPATGGFSEAV